MVLSPLLHSLQVPKHHEHKIRNLDTLVGWFKSKSEEPLVAPPEGLDSKESNVYVHQCGQCVQVWIMVNGEWQDEIKDGYHHPTLPNYRLYMRMGMNLHG